MPTLLIVDDEAKMRRLLELQLTQAGFAVVSADSAEEGLARLREQPVDLVVTDLRLPGMEDWRCCRR